MLVGNFITDEIPPLKTTDTVEMALDWMEQFKVSHLAVVENKKLIGLVSEMNLWIMNIQKKQYQKVK
jgi:acetoin utilization protein AcuB